MVLVVALNLLGDSVRDAFDPKNSSLTSFAREKHNQPRKGWVGHAVEETDHRRLRRRHCLHLAACGGSGDDSPLGEPTTTFQTAIGSNAGSGQDPNRAGPGARDRGRPEGRHASTVISVAGLNTMDPTEAYYINTALDPERPGHPVADAVRLRPEDQARWSWSPTWPPTSARRTTTSPSGRSRIRDGVKYENGQPVTPEDIAFGIERSFDRTTFPEGAAYSNDYFLDGDTYRVPTPASGDYDGVDDQRQHASPSRWPSRSRTCRTGVRSRPWARSRRARPATRRSTRCTRGRPARTCSSELHPGEVADAGQEPQLGPGHRPGSSPVPRRVRHEVRRPDARKIDQIMLKDTGDGQTTLTYDNMRSPNFVTSKQDASDRLVIGSVAVHVLLGTGQPQDHRHRRPPGARLRLPVPGRLGRRWQIAGVTRVPGTNMMPPGYPRADRVQPAA